MGSLAPFPADRICLSRVRMSPFLVAAFLGLFGWLIGVSQTEACPFCARMGKTLSQNVEESDIVIFGKLSGAKIDSGTAAGIPDGSTRMEILRVIKSNPLIAGKKDVLLPRYIADAEEGSVDYLVFAEVVKGKLDPYRGMPIPDIGFVNYLSGAMEVNKDKPAKRLAYFFQFLENDNEEVATDAYKVFAEAPFKEVEQASKSYDSQKILRWIRSEKTPTYQVGLLGCLLGTCGTAKDAAELRTMLDDPNIRPLTGLDGLMGGYCLLDPEKGTQFVFAALNNRENDMNFRYAALRTIRFMLAEMPQISRLEIFAQMAKALTQSDIADFLIDDFRKEKEWGYTDAVLALYDKPGFQIQIVRRAILRYALECPNDTAKQFVEKVRAADPQFVADVEEILRFEKRSNEFGSGRDS